MEGRIINELVAEENILDPRWKKKQGSQLYRLLENSLATSAPNGLLQRVTIPDAVVIQFNLLMMSMLLLEKCRAI
jgi:hypothetical protein